MLNRIKAAVRALGNLRHVLRGVWRRNEQIVQLQYQLGVSAQALANTEHERLLRSESVAIPKRLEKFGNKKYSQNDEDGIIEEIFRRIGTTNRRFVEFGAGNGLENNTAFLLCQGWSGLWLDGASANIKTQQEHFDWAIQRGALASVQSFLTVDNINSVIADGGFRDEIDLLSIDIDGNDYHLWKAIDVVQPRVVVIEYNAYAPPPVQWVMEYKEDYVWDGQSIYFNSSLESLERLGREKGYRLVGCNLIGLNAFFVRSDLADDHFCDDASASALYHPRRWWIDLSCNVEMIHRDQPYVPSSENENGRQS